MFRQQACNISINFGSGNICYPNWIFLESNCWPSQKKSASLANQTYNHTIYGFKYAYVKQFGYWRQSQALRINWNCFHINFQCAWHGYQIVWKFKTMGKHVSLLGREEGGQMFGKGIHLRLTTSLLPVDSKHFCSEWGLPWTQHVDPVMTRTNHYVQNGNCLELNMLIPW